MDQNSRFLEQLLMDIETFSFQPIEKRMQNQVFELWSDPDLSSHLSGNVGAFIVRAILNQLGVDEHRVFKWRIENKFWQYCILNHYIPSCMAETVSVRQLLSEPNGESKVRNLCNNGFFLKSTLGDGSGRGNSFDRTAQLEEIITAQQYSYEEDWILQKRLDLQREFRVHSFGRDVIYGLTMLMTDLDNTNIPTVEGFVKVILERLPEAIVDGTLIGWDIGLTQSNEIYIIEANITGFHPQYNPGFQTSGYFGDFYYGPIMCAWLNNYFRNKYRLSVGIVEKGLLQSFDFYKEFVFYKSIFKTHHFDILCHSRFGDSQSAILYIGEDINSLSGKLLDFMQLGLFASDYFLITYPRTHFTVSSYFSRNKLIKVISEADLFPGSELSAILHLDYDQREEKSCNQALRQIKDKACFII